MPKERAVQQTNHFVNTNVQTSIEDSDRAYTTGFFVFQALGLAAHCWSGQQKDISLWKLGASNMDSKPFCRRRDAEVQEMYKVQDHLSWYPMLLATRNKGPLDHFQQGQAGGPNGSCAVVPTKTVYKVCVCFIRTSMSYRTSGIVFSLKIYFNGKKYLLRLHSRREELNFMQYSLCQTLFDTCSSWSLKLIVHTLSVVIRQKLKRTHSTAQQNPGPYTWKIYWYLSSSKHTSVTTLILQCALQCCYLCDSKIKFVHATDDFWFLLCSCEWADIMHMIELLWKSYCDGDIPFTWILW